MQIIGLCFQRTICTSCNSTAKSLLAHAITDTLTPQTHSYFAATLAAEIAAAKAEGRYSEGVSDLTGSSITIKGQPEVRP